MINQPMPGLTPEAGDKRYLKTTGGTMSGDIAMGGKKVTGLGTPTADGDAVNKKYVDDKITTPQLIVQMKVNANNTVTPRDVAALSVIQIQVSYAGGRQDGYYIVPYATGTYGNLPFYTVISTDSGNGKLFIVSGLILYNGTLSYCNVIGTDPVTAVTILPRA